MSKKGYTIKQRFTGVLLVALIPFMLLLVGVTEVAARFTGTLLSLWIVTRTAHIVDWYGELLATLRKEE